MTATDAQVRLLMKERNKGKTQEQAAVKENLRSRKTVSKYEKSGKLPSEMQEPRAYHTRPDAFSAVWDEVAMMLEQCPQPRSENTLRVASRKIPGRLSGKPITHLPASYPSLARIASGSVVEFGSSAYPRRDAANRRDVDERIADHNPERTFRSSANPQRAALLQLQWGRIAQSELLLSIRLGLQSALIKLGHIPTYHQTDNSTAATNNLGAKAREKSLAERGYNEE